MKIRKMKIRILFNQYFPIFHLEVYNKYLNHYKFDIMHKKLKKNTSNSTRIEKFVPVIHE